MAHQAVWEDSTCRSVFPLMVAEVEGVCECLDMIKPCVMCEMGVNHSWQVKGHMERNTFSGTPAVMDI